MGVHRDIPRKARREAPVAAGPLRSNHKAALKKIWDKRPCLPSVASRKAWASARGLDPTSVNRWFYAQLQKARTLGFKLDAKNGGYDLEVDDGSPVEGTAPSTPLDRDFVLHSTTPEGLPELYCYEYSTSSETGLRIPLSPGQSSSPIFGSSFYSPKLTLESSSGAYGHLTCPEQFVFTPPGLPGYKRTTQSRSHSQSFAEERRTQIHQRMSHLPVSPTPNNYLPRLPLAPKKPRPSRGSHDILNFRYSPSTSSPTPMPSGYPVPYHISPWEQEEDDKPFFSDLRSIVTKTSRPTGQKQGGCISDYQSLNDRDNQTILKCLLTLSVLCTIAQTVRPSKLSISSAPINTSHRSHRPSSFAGQR